MYGCNCLSLAALRKEEFGRLKEMEEEKSSHEHRKDDSPDRDIEISPAPVVSFGATRRSRDVTRVEVRITSVIGEESPSNE